MPLDHNSSALFFLQTVRFSRIKDRWIINDPSVQKQLLQIDVDHKFSNFDDHSSTNFNDNFSTNVDVATASTLSDFDASHTLAKRSFVTVVTETVFDYPNIFVSEKTYKPIFNKRPFILVSSAGCLSNLKEVGFKTFGDYWDESYDSIIDPTKRMLAIVDIIKTLCTKSVAELQDMCYAMAPILEHNFNHLTGDLVDNEKNKFTIACQHNLQGIR